MREKKVTKEKQLFCSRNPDSSEGKQEMVKDGGE
jgi:hypothetical protein